MSKSTWFTSDLHFFHKNIIQFCNRPWTFEEQTNEIIKRWNAKVGVMDNVYSLGDFAFGGPARFEAVVDIIKELNGNITFIRGNHCDRRLWKMIEDANIPHVVEICDYKEISIDGTKVCLFHFPIVSWNSAHHGAYHLFGHSHGSYDGKGKSMDVGIDCNPDHAPFSWDDIKRHMVGREYSAVDHHSEGRR
jgi:calcineurin-like phosphoesterase family protein